MANINTNSRDRGAKKNRPKKENLRVDFTPMVDMNMLLITFFMFCTTLCIPQVVDIVMPANDEIPPDERPMVVGSRTVTVILDKEDKIFYYSGMPQYDDYTSLKETDYAGLRGLLLERNHQQVTKIVDLKRLRYKKEITDAQYKEGVREAKNSKEACTVVIKPTKNACYKNLVDALDEMQICGIGRYVVVDPVEGDEYLLKNYEAKGKLTAQL